jgi:hypothetical protein
MDAKWAAEVHRVLKPGAYLVVCGAPRSHHRMMCGIEDAGFVVRDCFAWLFGSGFPKNKNLGDGRGTALKPAHEPIALAWKPFKGSISGNVAQFGTGALNIDACRLDVSDDEPNRRDTPSRAHENGMFGVTGHNGTLQLGRWPANVLLDEEAAALLDKQTGELVSGKCDGGFVGERTDFSARTASTRTTSIGPDDSLRRSWRRVPLLLRRQAKPRRTRLWHARPDRTPARRQPQGRQPRRRQPAQSRAAAARQLPSDR